ncbi:hypothetical protein [Psychrobacter sp. FDAARGOS_221]|uniref:hypothetical protein n=1 Tax=Psychrobacter sp. FDAARGOS_221 TaxID=1975705 RepID=UPI000BB55884|nr:hypothetical protein [Psychrobacter sp. FDAARGOS_221]PNK59850.1 hypothetical protein A6J60_002450 [Psychrobacter sp. FDAARGOS_221]
MFETRIEDYWITRPDTLNLGYIKDLNHFLILYNLSIAYQPCEDLPDFGILQLSKEDAKTILDVLKDNSLINDYIKHSIQNYIAK